MYKEDLDLWAITFKIKNIGVSRTTVTCKLRSKMISFPSTLGKLENIVNGVILIHIIMYKSRSKVKANIGSRTSCPWISGKTTKKQQQR
jgi:hypothetical protein